MVDLDLVAVQLKKEDEEGIESTWRYTHAAAAA